MRQLIRLLAVSMVSAGVASATPEEDLIQELGPYRGEIVTDFTIHGNHVTREFVIAREIWSEVGDPLDPDLVHDDVIRLENLAIFGSVTVTASPQDRGVALNFTFTEMPWLIPYPAFSWNEQNGFSIGLGVASPNFVGRHINLSASALGGGTTTFNVSAKNPWITGNHVSAEILARHNVRQNTLLDFEETTTQTFFTGGTYIRERGRLLASLGYYSVGSNRDGITLSPNNCDDIFYAAASLGYDSRDSWRQPRAGWLTDLSPIYFGGDANTWTLNLDIRRFLPMGTRHSFATGPLLSLQSGEVGSEIPSYLQYFLGGSNSIRGYTLDELGQELYGKNQFLYTLEYRFTLVPMQPFKIFKWSISAGLELAGFGDAGVAWSRARDLSLDRTKLGYGAGIRALLPGVNMIRFDVGISQFGDVVFNFGVNSIFEARRQRIR